MKATFSLKQLRTDPREYIRLLNRGYEVEITEHNKTIAKAVRLNPPKHKRGNIEEILRVLDSLPATKTPFPDEDTVELVKRTRREHLERKFGGDS